MTLSVAVEKCGECGYPIQSNYGASYVQCDACRTLFENRNVSITAQLIFKGQESKPYEIVDNITIHRNEDNQLTIFYQAQTNMKTRYHLDASCVSYPHLHIRAEHENTLQEDKTGKRVVKKTVCYIEDVSRYGTEVNDIPLKTGEQRRLAHGDSIILAPGQNKPVSITFFETMKKT